MDYIQRLKDLREDKNLNQQKVAEYLDMKQQQYSNYERGLRELPIKHLIALCKYYNVSSDYILGFTNDLKELPKN